MPYARLERSAIESGTAAMAPMESYAEDYEDQHQNLGISDVIGHNSVK